MIRFYFIPFFIYILVIIYLSNYARLQLNIVIDYRLRTGMVIF